MYPVRDTTVGCIEAWTRDKQKKRVLVKVYGNIIMIMMFHLINIRTLRKTKLNFFTRDLYIILSKYAYLLNFRFYLPNPRQIQDIKGMTFSLADKLILQIAVHSSSCISAVLAMP